METPKPRSGASEVPKKVSPRVARQLKVSPVGFGSSSPASPSTNATKTPKERSPKITERKSPKSPVIPEKKRPSRLTELENQLQDDLKKGKDELSASRASKKEAKAIGEGLQQQLSAVSSKLDESQKQLAELSASKEADVAELRGISEEKDRAWETQLDIVRKQHSIDASALTSALDEVQTLKKQLEMVNQYEESSTHIELQSLKSQLSETLLLFENMKTEIESCRESEALAQGLVQETLSQLEEAKQTVNALRNDELKAVEAYNSVASELEDSRARVALLEGVVNQLKARPLEFRHRDELEAELVQAKSTIEELKADLMDKETELQGISEENECLNLKLRESSASNHQEDKPENDLKSRGEEVANLKASLMNKETELQNVKEENETLKSELRNQKEAGRVAEQDALEAAQAENAELEAELRRLKVQSDQWRKAAEAAASMLSSPVGNGRLVQRTGSLDSPVTGRVRSPYLDEYDEDDDDDEDAFKKKNGNVLRKIGGFWKKPLK